MAAPSVFFIAAFMPQQRGFKNQVITQTVWQTICCINFLIRKEAAPKDEHYFPSLFIQIQSYSLRRRTVKHNLTLLLSLVVLASMILTGCGGAPATEATGTEHAATGAPAAGAGTAIL